MEKIKVADIINTHGIKGELKIQRIGIETFDRDIDYFIGDNMLKVNIEKSRIHKGFYILKLKEFNNINEVLQYKGKEIYINKEDLQELEEDEFYILDLVGIKVFENDNYIGEIIEVLHYDANDVYIIETSDREIYLPAVEEFILNVDIENSRLDVKLIEGM